MDTQTAQMALHFMSRTQLQGNEVAAWIQVFNALQEIANEKSLSPPNDKSGPLT